MMQRVLAYGLIFVTCAALFALAPIPFDDWHTFRMVALGEWRMYHNSGYFNPPYVAAILLPVALLPERIGYGLLSAATITALFYACVRKNLSPFRAALLLASPPMVYTLLHGQIDMLILAAALFAPPVLRPLVALAKPQCALGLALRVPRRLWGLAAGLGVAMYVVCALFVGWWWAYDLIVSLSLVNNVGWNAARPFIVPVGMWLMLEGYNRDNDELFLAASPLLLPYAAPSSFIVPLFVLMRRASSAFCLTIFVSGWLIVLL